MTEDTVTERIEDDLDEEETVTLDKGNFEELMVAMLQDLKEDIQEIKEQD